MAARSRAEWDVHCAGRMLRVVEEATDSPDIVGHYTLRYPAAAADMIDRILVLAERDIRHSDRNLLVQTSR